MRLAYAPPGVSPKAGASVPPWSEVAVEGVRAGVLPRAGAKYSTRTDDRIRTTSSHIPHQVVVLIVDGRGDQGADVVGAGNEGIAGEKSLRAVISPWLNALYIIYSATEHSHMAVILGAECAFANDVVVVYCLLLR